MSGNAKGMYKMWRSPGAGLGDTEALWLQSWEVAVVVGQH